jgi:hypothetical protein
LTPVRDTRPIPQFMFAVADGTSREYRKIGIVSPVSALALGFPEAYDG